MVSVIECDLLAHCGYNPHCALVSENIMSLAVLNRKGLIMIIRSHVKVCDYFYILRSDL